MAKVFGPLHSDSASGQHAKASVYASRKGQNVVRRYLIPKNPKTGEQGDQRLVLGGTGRAVGSIKLTSPYSDFLLASGLVTGIQTKQSYGVKRIIAEFMPDITAFEAMNTEYLANGAQSDFADSAASVGLFDFKLKYQDSLVTYSGGLQLYMVAKLGFAIGLTSAPFDTALEDWDDTNVAELITALTPTA